MPVPVDEPLRRVRMSWDEFLDLPERPRSEWVNGEVVTNVAPVSFSHGDAVVSLSLILRAALPDLYLLTEVGLWLPGSRLRAPDLMVTQDRSVDEHGWVTEPPALVVEVLSRSTRSEDTIRKSSEYARGRVGQYWVVDPDFRVIDAYGLVENEWELIARVDEKHPKAEVQLAGVTVPLDIEAILRR